MGMTARNEKDKSQLAAEICELWARAIACSNLHHPRTDKSPFVDWYLVLRVDENADVRSIRKQYRKLALLLHPDKNTHSEAETAFKLVSEAYCCLSDTARRSAFDSERKRFSCVKCNRILYINTDTSTPANARIQETSKHSRIQRRMKELHIKLTCEVKIIEKCLTTNATKSSRERKKAYRKKTETPVFNPSDYQHKGYPHHRAMNCEKLGDSRAGFMIGDIWVQSQSTVNYESPIFEHRSGRSVFHV